MPYVTYKEHNGPGRTVAVDTGCSIMEGAIKNDIPGIVAECGGACSCATCHVYVEPDWLPQAGAPSEAEAEMLQFAFQPRANSRLACQIVVTPELSGLIVQTPERQC
jgi:2Fe-2S ferredoxin